MLDVFTEINFEDRINELKDEYPSIRSKLQQVSKEIAKEIAQTPEYQKPTLDDGSMNSIILFNLPTESGERLDKFQKVFVGSIAQKLNLKGFQRIIMEGAEAKQGTGVGICVFDTSENALAGSDILNGYKLGAFKIQSYTMSEYESIVNTQHDSGIPSKFYSKKEMTAWLEDERKRQQFALASDTEIAVDWHEHYEKTMKPYASITTPANFKETKWSPDGCYLAVLVQSGFTVYSVVQEGLKEIRHYSHKEVKNVEFSPCERYILSYNGTMVETRDSKNFVVWNLLTGEELRVFHAEQTEGWESFQWSFDGNYIAKRKIENSSDEGSLKDNCYLNIYQLPSMKLLEDPKTKQRLPIRIPYLQKFSWAKNSHKIICVSYNSAMDNKNPSYNKAVIYSIPSRDETRWISIPYLVHEAQIVWGPSDKYVMVALETHERKGHTKKVKAINVQVGTFGKLFELEFYRKEFLRVKSVHINKAGTRLAAVSPVKNDQAKLTGQSMYYNVEVHELEEEKKAWQLKPVGGLGKVNGDCIIWPDVGNFFLVTASGDGERRNHGHVNFAQIRVVKSTDPKVPPKSDCEFIKENDFSSISSIGWDPSGSYITVTNSLNNSFDQDKVEKYRFWVYNAIGKQLYKETVPKLRKCFWRPNVSVIVPEKTIKAVADNMKEITKRYEEEDDKILNVAEFELRKRREREAKEFAEYMSKKSKVWVDSKAERVKLRGFDDDQLQDVVEVEIEDVVDVEKEENI